MKNILGTTGTIFLSAIDDTCFNFPLKGKKKKRMFFELLKGLIPFKKKITIRQLLAFSRNLVSSHKEQIQMCLATVTIGAIFLGSVLAFFTQLAEYGW